jgi:hypothetical protein
MPPFVISEMASSDVVSRSKEEEGFLAWWRNSLLPDWRDTCLGLALSVAIGLALYHVAGVLPPFISHTDDFWFQADTEKVVQAITLRESLFHPKNRSRTHPLFPLLTYVPVYVLKHAFHIEPSEAVRIFYSGVASLWSLTLFALLKILGCRRMDAAAFTLLASVSASFLFFFVVPETFGLGSLTILLAFLFVARTELSATAPGWYVVISTLSLSVTVTNWMFGVLAGFVTYPWKRVLQLSAYALCLAVVLWGVQKLLIPDWPFFLPNFKNEAKYVLRPEAGGALVVARSFLFHSMVVPAIDTVEHSESYVWVNGQHMSLGPWLTTQASSPGSGSLWGRLAVCLWAILILIGCFGLLRLKQHGRLRIMLVLTILGQLALHILYGEETFLYSLHFLPLLIVVAAASTFTKARPYALVLVGLLLMTTAINNAQLLLQASKLAQGAYLPQKQR